MKSWADAEHIEVIDRWVFLDEYWNYKPGEMVTVLAPYGMGKTSLGLDLLEKSASPDLQAVVFKMKKYDDTIDTWVACQPKERRYREISMWPPPRSRFLMKKPPGYVLEPAHFQDTEREEAHQRVVFKECIEESYAHAYGAGGRILFADEAYSLEKELDLARQLNRVLTKGRSHWCGMWYLSQRAAWISKWAYQAHHLFLARDPDPDARKRLADIGGAVDVDIVRSGLDRLELFQFVYVNRNDRTIGIVTA